MDKKTILKASDNFVGELNSNEHLAEIFGKRSYCVTPATVTI